jgi:hypothetical protein
MQQEDERFFCLVLAFLEVEQQTYTRNNHRHSRSSRDEGCWKSSLESESNDYVLSDFITFGFL